MREWNYFEKVEANIKRTQEEALQPISNSGEKLSKLDKWTKRVIKSKKMFQTILDSGKTPSAEQKKLIERQEGRTSIFDNRFLDHPHSEVWESCLKDNKKNIASYFRERLSGKTLLDLGGGRMTDYIKEIADISEASVYINIDRSNKGIPNEYGLNPLVPIPYFCTAKKTLCMKILADMLDFISRVRDGVANCTLNGIDSCIINDPAYNQALAHEMIRVTPKGGIIFGTLSGALDYIDNLIEEEKCP